MSFTKTLDTPKGPLEIEIRFLQMCDSNQKKLIEMKAFSLDPKFFHKQEIKIPWNEDAPSEKEIDGFEKKVSRMFNPEPLKGKGYAGKLR